MVVQRSLYNSISSGRVLGWALAVAAYACSCDNPSKRTDAGIEGGDAGDAYLPDDAAAPFEGGDAAEGSAGSAAVDASAETDAESPEACPPVRADVSSDCPLGIPPIEQECATGAICAYERRTVNDCSITTALCAAPRESWRLTSRGCREPTGSPEWRGSWWLHLAELEGDCGPLGSMIYQPDEGYLDELHCDPVQREVTGCRIQEELACVGLGGDVEVQFILDLDWTGEEAVGVASVVIEASEACSSEYHVRAVR